MTHSLRDAGVSDEELMLRYRAGDAGAFDALYARHKGAVFRYLRRQAGAAAEDLFQDVWMRVINARDRYEERARFTTWLFTIAHNRLMDHFRAAGRVQFASYDDEGEPGSLPIAELVPADGPTPSESYAHKSQAAQLLAALDTLPAAQREALLLQQEGELSIEEIAAATGVNRETAKSRLRYAMAKLRAQLKDGR